MPTYALFHPDEGLTPQEVDEDVILTERAAFYHYVAAEAGAKARTAVDLLREGYGSLHGETVDGMTAIAYENARIAAHFALTAQVIGTTLATMADGRRC